MAASTTPRTAEVLALKSLAQEVLAQQASLQPASEPAQVVAVAFSGGRDSTALLHATAHSAQALGLQVAALHVHHGLMAEADDWLAWAQALCKRWQARGLPVSLHWHRLAQRPAKGDSIEAWARKQRYQALGQMARAAGAHIVLLAHHRRDQAETVLLQALRGGGPAALAAMPAQIERDGLTWARPWLAHPREAIEAYVRQHRLKHIEDGSNADPRYARNRLRLQIWPALTGAFADTEQALAAVARRAQEADAALAELAELDLATVAPAEQASAALHTAPWSRLSPARRANALRGWLRSQTGQGAAESLVQRLLQELPGASTGRWPLDGPVELRLYRGQLSLATVSLAPAALPSSKPGSQPGVTLDTRPGTQPSTNPPVQLALAQPGTWPVPSWGGAFAVSATLQQGLSAEHLAAVQLQPRSGGEQFQLAPRSLPRSLKKQFQALAVPEAGRQGPLLWSPQGQLLYVPGLGIDARAWAAPGQPQWTVRWIPGA